MISEQEIKTYPCEKFWPSYHSSVKEGGEITVARGVIDVEKRCINIPDALLRFEDFVGTFRREDGATNISHVGKTIALLNGCEVEVKIKVLKIPIHSQENIKEEKQE